MTQKNSWKEYYENTGSTPPSQFLMDTLKYLNNDGVAIDLGAGALRDSKYLLEQGFSVTAIDKSPDFEEETLKIEDPKFKYYVSTFEEYQFPISGYDLAYARYSLPFNPPDSFDAVFNRIIASLKPNGIFAGQLFGDRDEWSQNPKMTFHTKEQAEELLKGMEILEFKEEDGIRELADGTPKHWHVFHVIAKKV